MITTLLYLLGTYTGIHYYDGQSDSCFLELENDQAHVMYEQWVDWGFSSRTRFIGGKNNLKFKKTIIEGRDLIYTSDDRKSYLTVTLDESRKKIQSYEYRDDYMARAGVR